MCSSDLEQATDDNYILQVDCPYHFAFINGVDVVDLHTHIA